jgi:hypothetical protein
MSLIPATSANTLLTVAKSMSKAAAAAALRNPASIYDVVKLLGKLSSSSTSQKKTRKLRKSTGGFSKAYTGTQVQEGTQLAPVVMGNFEMKRRGNNMLGRPQICRELGSFTASTRAADTELTYMSIALAKSSAAGAYALYLRDITTLVGGDAIGPQEIGPNRLKIIASTYAWYAIRYLKLKFKTSCSTSSVQGATQFSFGLVRSRGLGWGPTEDLGNVASQQDVDALNTSVTWAGWQNAELVYKYDGDRVWSTIQNGGTLNSEQCFQLSSYCFGDAQNTADTTLLAANVEAEYVVDFYESVPSVGQSSDLQDNTKVIRDHDGLKVVSDHTCQLRSNRLSMRQSVSTTVSQSHKSLSSSQLAPRSGKDETTYPTYFQATPTSVHPISVESKEQEDGSVIITSRQVLRK